MKKFYALVILVLFSIACAAGRTQIIEPRKLGFKNFAVLEITDFENNVGPACPTEICSRIPDSVAEKVKTLNLFKAVNRVPIETEVVAEEKTLILKGNIIEYNPGSRGKRYLAGAFGWGKGFIMVRLTAIDKKTREEIFKGNCGAELSGGVFGGSFSGAVDKLVDEVVKCIQMNY